MHEVMVLCQSSSPWIRLKRICPCGPSWLLIISTVDNDKSNTGKLLRLWCKMHLGKCKADRTDLLCCSFYSHPHTLNSKRLFSIEFSTGIRRCMKAVWEHWKTFNWYSVDTKLLPCDVHMIGANLVWLFRVFSFCSGRVRKEIWEK